jgi:hypothetical protein
MKKIPVEGRAKTPEGQVKKTPIEGRSSIEDSGRGLSKEFRPVLLSGKKLHIINAVTNFR